MATNSQRAKSIIDAWKNEDVDDATITRIVKNYLGYEVGNEDPEPTDSVLALRFIESLVKVAKGGLRAHGEAQETTVHQAAIKNAGDVAEGDL